MQYICLIYGDEQAWQGMSDDERNQMFAAYGSFTESIQQSGQMVAGDALQPTTTATTVRVRDGETLVTDGPFLETKEVLGGYLVADCRDLDAAIELAQRVPLVGRGSVEIRPVVTH